jgi:long-subunit acyl-CoA synthetase (AMP-forming)
MFLLYCKNYSLAIKLTGVIMRKNYCRGAGMNKQASFYELLKKRAEQCPERTAVLYDTFAVTYKKLYEDVVKKAVHLSRYPGKRVTLYGPASYRWIVNMFGIVLAGKDAILIDFFIPQEARMQILTRVGTDYILSSTNQYILADNQAIMLPNAEKDNSDLSEFDDEIPEGNIMMFTATENESDKAVVLTPSGFVHMVDGIRKKVICGEDDRVLSQIALHQTFGLVYSLLWPLSCGACVCVGRGLRHIEADTYYYKATVLPGTPSMIKYLKRVKAFNQELKTIVIGGAPCPYELFECLKDRDFDVYTVYGMMECTGSIGINDTPDGAYDLIDSLKVTFAEDGEILVGGDCIMKGYDKDLEANEKVIVNGIYHTGDYGHMNPAGRLVIDRRKSGVLLLPTGECICSRVINDELTALKGIAESSLVLYEDKLTAVIVPIDKNKTADRFKKLIDSYNEKKGYRWEIQQIVVSQAPLPKLPDGSVDEAEVINTLLS